MFASEYPSEYGGLSYTRIMKTIRGISLKALGRFLNPLDIIRNSGMYWNMMLRKSVKNKMCLEASRTGSLNFVSPLHLFTTFRDQLASLAAKKLSS